jgi:glycosyltransferase involved in cell wall biosynthesis
MEPVKKVLYISNPFYLDYDLSLIKFLSEETDLHYFLDISPISAHATILRIENYIRKPGILDGSIYNISKLYGNYLPEKKTFIINRRTNKPSLSNLILQFKLAGFIRRLGPDIIHFNTDFTHNYFLFYFILKIPIICTIHDPVPHSDDDGFKENSKRAFFYRFIKNFIILNSNQNNEFIARYKLSRKNVYISELGIYDYIRSGKPMQELNRRHSSGENLKILFFGRINKYKGLAILLSAFNSIILKYPGTRLVIAGEGRLTECNGEPLNNVTIINRYIENDELSSLISDSDFVVCPYLNATQSGVIMTAFGFAKPVIATNVGSLNKFVEDGYTGLLIEPGNSSKLRDAIEKFIKDPGLLDQISINIMGKYHTGVSSWKTIARNTINIYKAVK